MNKITLLLILFSINSFSQIQIEKPKEEDNINKTLIAEFNDKIDLPEYRTAEQFLGIVGKEILFLPVNSRCTFASDRFDNISYLPQEKFKLNKVRYKANTVVNLDRAKKDLYDYLEIEGNYFIVESVKFYDNSYSWKKETTGFDFNEKQEKYPTIFSASVDLYLRHKKSNEIVIFNISSNYDADKLISVPFYNQLVDKYSDQKIILKKVGYFNYKDNESLDNFELKALNSSRVINVKKIVLKEPKSEYVKYYVPVFVLQNSNKELQEIEYTKIKDDIIFYDDFIVEAKIKAKKDSIRLAQIEKTRITNELKEKEQEGLHKIQFEKERVERRNKMIKKYGKSYGETIANYKVRIGMTKEMCEDAWGKPNSINRTTNTYGTSEQWVYGGGNYLYFDNNKLTSIQN